MKTCLNCNRCKELKKDTVLCKHFINNGVTIDCRVTERPIPMAGRCKEWIIDTPKPKGGYPWIPLTDF